MKDNIDNRDTIGAMSSQQRHVTLHNPVLLLHRAIDSLLDLGGVAATAGGE
jgi:hypothetical protein